MRSAQTIPGASPERQGAGALDAGRAVTLALADRHGLEADTHGSPWVTERGVAFRLLDQTAREVAVVGSWNGWRRPGLSARPIEQGLWEACLGDAPPGRHQYKFLVDGERWLADPANPARAHDGHGGVNSVLPA